MLRIALLGTVCGVQCCWIDLLDFLCCYGAQPFPAFYGFFPPRLVWNWPSLRVPWQTVSAFFIVFSQKRSQGIAESAVK